MRRALYILALIIVTQVGLRGQECPAIEVICPTEVINQGTPVTFNTDAACTISVRKLEYAWTVSAGTIIEGQGTSKITVDTSGLFGLEITATVELMEAGIKSYGKASGTVTIGGCGMARKFDEYGDISFEDEKARLDNFAIELKNSPDVKGYVIAYGGRQSRVGEAAARLDRIKAYLIEKRGLAPDRLLIQDGGYREELTVDFYIVPKDGSLPIAAPTVTLEAKIKSSPK